MTAISLISFNPARGTIPLAIAMLESTASLPLEVLSLVELLPADVAAQKSTAVLIDFIGEVLTDHADTASLPVLKLPFVDEIPIPHPSNLNSPSVLIM